MLNVKYCNIDQFVLIYNFFMYLRQVFYVYILNGEKFYYQYMILVILKQNFKMFEMWVVIVQEILEKFLWEKIIGDKLVYIIDMFIDNLKLK